MSGELYINGQWQPGSGAQFRRSDPVYGHPVWEGAGASAGNVRQAVSAARQAFDPWRRSGLDARQAVVEAFARELTQNKASLAQALAEETGKPLWESATEIDAMVGKVGLSLQAYHARTGESEKTVAAGHSVLRHRPHGVLAVFGPYNFPGHLPNGHIVPALIAGNTLVFKPSELTPRFAELTVQLWEKAGLPAGVLNLVQGARETGEALAGDADLDGLLFTGSSATGEILHRQFAGQPGKILALEMGGNNPLILAGEWDEAGALHHVLFSAFVSAGQRCTCARRLLVPQGKSGDRFLDALVQATSLLEVGAYDADPQPFMGSLISPGARARVQSAWSHRLSLGGKVLLEPTAMTTSDLQEACLLTPGIIDVSEVSELADEEIFGPLLQVQRYETFDQAMDLANATRYGLAAGLISDDHTLYDRFLLDIRAGIVNWNKPLTGASSAAPFGGVGLSGNHRPGAWYAADYCAWPMASLIADQAQAPTTLPPGMTLPENGS